METAKLRASKVKYPATIVFKWNTQRSACVFHLPNPGRTKRYRKGMSLEVTSIGFVGTNPESTPLPGVDYSKDQQEVYEAKRYKAPIAVEPERERRNLKTDHRMCFGSCWKNCML